MSKTSIDFGARCDICTESYNTTTRVNVCCPYCDYTSCRTCCKTYLLSQNIPKCMNGTCNKEWSRKFLRENFSDDFINKKYKAHVETILFDQERALLPATQPLVEEIIRKERVEDELLLVNKRIKILIARRNFLQMSLHQRPGTGGEGEGEGEGSSSSTCFVRACPGEECRGYLDKKWRCGLCENLTCSKCHELIGKEDDKESHVCDPNNVETAALLKNDSKPCPKCHSLIFKINGCDQMWCTQCHTAFSWKTGELQKTIHNPHYFEWQRQNGGVPRAAGDIECGRAIDHHTAGELFDLRRDKHTNLIKTRWRGQLVTPRIRIDNPDADLEGIKVVERVADSIRNILHLTNAVLHRFQVDYVERNQNLRIRYMRNIISEEEFKREIQRNDKKSRKSTEIAHVIQLVNTVMTDIIYRFMDHLRQAEPNQYSLTIDGEMDGAVNYCNNLLRESSFTYKSVLYILEKDFRMFSNTRLTKNYL